MTLFDKLQINLQNSQSKWLITGVAGFIGSNLLERLLILNQKVYGLDNFQTGYKKNIHEAIKNAEIFSGKSLSQNFVFFEGDITELQDCKNACKGIDYVLHHAALGSVPMSIKDPILSNKVNVDGFLNMLFASNQANVKRFIYASSSAAYGDNSLSLKVEDNIGQSLSPYAVNKLVNELYSEVFSKTYGFKSIGLRYFNIFGKRQDPNGPYAAVIPLWIKSMINNERVFINGDGETSRDYCFIDNVVQINLLAATTKNPKALDQVYNVALNSKTSLNELHNLIHIKLVNKINGLKKESPIYRDFRDGDIRHSQADISKATELLGYCPTHNLNDGIEAVIDWYIDNTK